jgi:ABC-type transport system involved in cytochrome bd biosynthesis fused ATPase/permease subunit
MAGGRGAGKTTLIDLLLRVRDADAGEVRIGGVAARSLSLEDVRARFAVAPQFPHLFDRSLADNLRLGAPDATEAEMREALAQVGLGGLLAQLPAGLASEVGPLGAKLSGGQVRRVAVARALLSPRPILLLDEPTEGLDSETERRLIDNLLGASPDRTIIAVSHSAEARARFERVVTVRGGEVAEAH